jgi:hypothetical protein
MQMLAPRHRATILIDALRSLHRTALEDRRASLVSESRSVPDCIPLICVNLPHEDGRSLARKIIQMEGRVMLRCILAVLAAFVLLTVCIIPDDAYARRGGGGFRGAGGGFHGARGGGMHAGRIHGGYRHAGRVRPSHPIAGRPIAGRPIAGRPGRPIAGYPGGGYYRPGWGYGAAVGAAAAAGAYGAYGSYYGNSNCYYDQYGRTVCPQQYPYYQY